MAFQPQMLPKNSWASMMENLNNYFGEDASLDVKTANHIKSYMMENAADAGWMDGKFMRGLSKTSTPMRITKTPFGVREHKEEVSPKAWSDPKVKSKANCVACHKKTNQGNYDDD